MQAKSHALTRLGDGRGKRFYVRRDANCPIVTHARRRKSDLYVAVPSWLVNLSEEGCLIASDDFPRDVEEVYLVIPGMGSKVHGKAKKQAKHTLHVHFTTLLPADIVDKVGRIKVIPRG